MVALTALYAVVATDLRYLRFFSLSGTQKFVASIPGPVVSMVGRENVLFVVYHAGGTFHGLLLISVQFG